MTIFFRNLSQFSIKDNLDKGTGLEFLGSLKESFYKLEQLRGGVLEKWKHWLELYWERLQKEHVSDEERELKMNKVNPKYVLRNYMAQMAIDALEDGDYSLTETLFNLLKKPYDEQSSFEKWFSKRPEWAKVKVGCSMLSCSS